MIVELTSIGIGTTDLVVIELLTPGNRITASKQHPANNPSPKV